jgi:hypothetical protein
MNQRNVTAEDDRLGMNSSNEHGWGVPLAMNVGVSIRILNRKGCGQKAEEAC